MELINVKTQKDLENLQEILRMANLSTKEHIWTSGTDLGSDGQFYWSSIGEDFTSAVPWLVLPDKKDSNKHCVELVNGTYLNDNNCDETFHYLCIQAATNDSEKTYFEILKNNTIFNVFYEKVGPSIVHCPTNQSIQKNIF